MTQPVILIMAGGTGGHIMPGLAVANALRMPEFLWHPYGPLTKNLPMLAVLWLLFEMEERREEKRWNT